MEIFCNLCLFRFEGARYQWTKEEGARPSYPRQSHCAIVLFLNITTFLDLMSFMLILFNHGGFVKNNSSFPLNFPKIARFDQICQNLVNFRQNLAKRTHFSGKTQLILLFQKLIQFVPGSYSFRGPSDQTVGPSLFFTFETNGVSLFE